MPPRKHLHADLQMPPVYPTARRQLRNLPVRQNGNPSQPVQMPTPVQRHQKSALPSLALSTTQNTDASSDENQSLAAYRHQEIRK